MKRSDVVRSQPRPVRVAVVGAGSMGSNHARVLASLKGAELVAVVDADPQRARAVAEQHGVRAVGNVSDLLNRADAAVVAVPSSRHCEVALELLASGIDCLVEKPIATDIAAARHLVDEAAALDRLLLVGHIERFNPAVEQLKKIVAEHAPIMAIDARRMSAVSSRITDVDVVGDLMIHDLEIVLDLLEGQELIDVVARGVGVGNEGGIDHVTAMLSFDSGTIATVTASRITQNKIRQLQVTTKDRLFTVDYSAQELLIHRQGRVGAVSGDDVADGSYVLDVGTELVFVRRSEPLAAELAHFVQAVRREVPPRVSGSAALRALEVAGAILDDVANSPARTSPATGSPVGVP